MEIRRGMASMALAAAGLAGAGGAWMLAPAVVGAQEEPTDDSTPADEEGRPEGGRCRGGHRGPGLEVAASTIGIEEDALREALEGGQSIAEVAEANGVDPQTVIDALVADATENINQKVADGDLTQEEADEKLAELPERITARVNGERPERPEGDSS